MARVHLAAVPAPGLRPNAATFHNNMTVTYNVFSAALRAGVRNIVWASSETVLGLPFDEDPPYLPVDEDYPPSTTAAPMEGHLGRCSDSVGRGLGGGVASVTRPGPRWPRVAGARSGGRAGGGPRGGSAG